MSEVAIPDIGDAEDVEIIEICVAPGDEVAANDALIVIESDKASMEVPAPYAGSIAEVLVALGDRVNTGDPIVRMDAAASVDAAPVDAAPPPPSPPPAPATPAEQPPSAPPAAPTVAETRTTAPSGATAYAGPAVRRLARELGVDLLAVAGTGARGRIVKDDVKAFVKRSLAARPADGAPAAAPPEADYARFGEIETRPLPRVRARGAENLQRAWRHVVHVTQHDEADVTDLEAFRKSLADEASLRGVKLSPLPFIVKACVMALRRHPQFNASLDATATSVIYKRYHHIGVAVDTADGLVVPVLRDADAKGIWELAEAIAAASAAARARRLKPDDLRGGSFTVSSLGAIGGTGFTPVVNFPEVAILGVARMDVRPVWDGGAFAPRNVLPLSLSYDHRVVNGAEAGRFLAQLKTLLGDVRRFAL